MIAYILKFSLCLMLLWGFYKLFLEKENIHFLKRFYLLFSLVFAFSIPLITLTYEVEVAPQSEIILDTAVPMVMNVSEVKEPIDYTSIIIWSIYGIGVLIFSIRFVKNLIDIGKKVRRNERLKETSHINVLVDNSIVPHTFLDFIFVPKKEFLEKAIPEEILLHEKTHVLQKHTFDILFVELLQVIFWFNPVFIFIKKAIRLNHEFLADQNVLKQQFSIQSYVDLLLNYKNSSNQAELSSPINYSLTKKRLQMMTKTFSKKRTTLRLFSMILVFSICILFFNNKIVAKEREVVFLEDLPLIDSPTPSKLVKLVNIDDELEKINNKEIHYLKPSSTKNTSEKRSTTSTKNWKEKDVQGGVTEEMVKEYNTWAKDLNTKIKGNKPIRVKQSEIYRMINIYKKMNADQRKRSEQFPDIPPPPPAPEAPRVQKGEKSDIPPPPPAPEAPKTPSKGNGSYVEVMFAEDSELTEEEKQEYIERVEARFAEQREEQERELEEIRAEEMEVLAESERLIAEAEGLEQENRRDAIAGIEEAEVQRAMAMERLQKLRETAQRTRAEAYEEAREAASRARAMALEEAQESRKRSEKTIRKAELQARKAAKGTRKEEMKVRKKAREAEMEAEKALRKAELNARKAEINARKIEMKARKVEQRARQMAISNTPARVIESMAKKDADFYYNGKQISAKEALKLVEDSDNTLSINASSNNGKSKVIIKD